MTVGYKFPILNSDGTPSTTYVDMEDMFVPADRFYEQGLYAWGRNSVTDNSLNDFPSGVIGDGAQVHRSSPVQVGALTNWKQVSGGYYHAIALKTDGTLWTWGFNHGGQLGQNNVVHRSSPVQVGALNNWKQASASNYSAAAVKTDGTLWTWGHNNLGQLGQGDSGVHRSSPVQVGALNNWKLVDVSAERMFAIKNDNTLWAWGNNGLGSLGLSLVNNARVSSPVQVGSLTNWKQISGGTSSTAAVKTDGTLWTWGSGSSGVLGSDNTTQQSSPIQIGSLASWKQISVGSAHMISVQTNGTLWAWGSNSDGRLGLGDLTNRSSPVQVGTLTNWKQAVASGLCTACVKTDGTLWTWGENVAGALGQGDLTNRSSPVQVGALTNWKLVASKSGTDVVRTLFGITYTY